MISLATFATPASACAYLPDRQSSFRFEFVAEATAAEYEARLAAGWRRFGRSWFRPQCPTCQACQSLRVDVAAFAPDRSMRRCAKANAETVRIEIGRPQLSEDRLALYDRFHEFQADNVGWPYGSPKGPTEYYESFVDNPFPSEEWRYFIGDRHVALGYVDAVPNALSAIYFFHEPDERDRGLGTWNVLSIIAEAARRGLPHVYLGYFVEGYRSLAYKGRFGPAEALDWDAMSWRPFALRNKASVDE